MRVASLASSLGLALWCCGGGTSSVATDGGNADARAGDAHSACGLPPSAIAAPQGDMAVVFAADQFFLGDSDFDGTPNPNAWQTLGFDLDGVDTTDPVGHPNCLSRDPRNLLDGTCGVDNSFAQLTSTVFGGSGPETALARSGQWTLLFEVRGLRAGGQSSGVSGAVYASAPLGSQPKFDGTDRWAPTTETAPEGIPLATWSAGYVAGETLVVTEPLVVLFDMPVGQQMPPRTARLTMHVLAIAMQLSADRTQVTRGVLAGVMRVEDFSAALTACSGDSAYLWRQADMLIDRTVDSSRPCDGVSFGIGFTARAVRLDAPRPAPPASHPGCPPADGG